MPVLYLHNSINDRYTPINTEDILSIKSHPDPKQGTYIYLRGHIHGKDTSRHNYYRSTYTIQELLPILQGAK